MFLISQKLGAEDVQNIGKHYTKAAELMKIDMVKPTPARKPAPTICVQLISDDIRAMPSFVASQTMPTIPSGLPMSSAPIR